MKKHDSHPHHPHPHQPHPHHPAHRPPASANGIPASRILDFAHDDQLNDWLQSLVPDAQDRAFVVRCLIGEGPIHHRGSNYVLLTLLSRAVQACGGMQPATDGISVPMRIPPHVAETMADNSYPVKLPLNALRELAGDDPQQLEAMIDCLTDGPPQHALANVVMVALIESLLAKHNGKPE